MTSTTAPSTVAPTAASGASSANPSGVNMLKRTDVAAKPEPYRDRGYRVVELPNALRLVLISDPRADRAAVAVSVRVGSLCEKPYGTDGLAHFLEHMLFLGTEKYPEEESYKRFLSKNGGGCNASTSDDWTRYHLYVSPPHLPEAADRIAQFFLEPLLDANCTSREMHAVDSEHKKNLQNEARRALQVFRGEADAAHPLNHFRTGSLGTLQKENIREVLLAFHRDFYSANLMGVALLGREPLAELEQIALAAGFQRVANKQVALPNFNFAFTQHDWHKSRVARIAKHVVISQEEEAPPPAAEGATSSGPPTPPKKVALPVVTVIEPVKEERYFAFQFFTEEQDRVHWREKTDSFWGHVLGYEGPGSLLSFLKRRGYATGLSAGMYYDGGGTGVFQVRVSLTKQKGVQALAEIGELLFKYFVMLKRDLVLVDLNKVSASSATDPSPINVEGEVEAETTPLRRIWEEQRDVGKLRFRFRPVADPVDSVLAASRNVLLYPAEEILSGGTLFHEPCATGKIREFFEYLRLDNLRLVVFHQGCTEENWQWYNKNSGAGEQQGAERTGDGDPGSSTGVLTEPHFGVKHRKPMPLHPELLRRWQNVDNVLDSLAPGTAERDAPAGRESCEASGKQAMKRKFDLAGLDLPDEFFVMRKNEFIPTNFDLHSTAYEEWQLQHGAYWPVKQYHDAARSNTHSLGAPVESTTTAATASARTSTAQIDPAQANRLYRLTIPFAAQTAADGKNESPKDPSGAEAQERDPAYQIFFKSTTAPYEEPRVYLKINLFSEFIGEGLDSYCETLFFVQTVLEKLNEDFYDSEICGLDYDVVTHSFGGLTIYVGGYSDKLFVLLEKLLDRFVNSLNEVEDEDRGVGRGDPKLASALTVLKERKLKAWYNAAYKRQPLEVASQVLDEAVAECDYPMLDMYRWLLQNHEKISCQTLRETQRKLFGRRMRGEGLVEGNVAGDAMREVARILSKHLPLPVHDSAGSCVRHEPAGRGGEGDSAKPGALPGFRKGVRRILADSVLVQPSPNGNDPNSATILCIQTGPYCRVKDLRKERETLFAGGLEEGAAGGGQPGPRDSFFDREEDKALVRTRTLNMLVTQFLAQPFFADLRTKQQLGYLVSARADSVNGMTGVHFRVQSSHTPCAELEKRIRAFLDSFEETVLLQKSEEEFEEFKKGIISKLEEKPKKLAQEFALHWSEISFRSMNFFWKDTAVAFLKELRREEFLQYWREEVYASPKMWVHVPGPTDDSVGREPVTDVKLGKDFEQLVNNRVVTV